MLCGLFRGSVRAATHLLLLLLLYASYVYNKGYLIMCMFKMSRITIIELGFYPDHYLTHPLTKNVVNSRPCFDKKFLKNTEIKILFF